MSTLREQMCIAVDTLNTMRRSYYQQQASYEDVSAAARALLELRQQAERKYMGKIKTRITSRAIASLIRSSF